MSEIPVFKSVQSHVKPYDLLNYFTPGATVLILIYIFESSLAGREAGAHSMTGHTVFATTLRSSFEYMASDSVSWIVPLIFFFALAVGAYISGHIISWGSFLFLDRMVLARCHGYPYSSLLQVRDGWLNGEEVSGTYRDLKFQLTRGYYRSLFFYMNLYFCLRFLSVSEHEHLATAWRETLEVAANFTAYWILLSAVIKISCSRFYATGVDVPAKAKFIMVVEATSWLFKVASLPYTLIANFMARYLRSEVPLPEDLRISYKRHFKKFFKVDPDKAGTSNFWLSYMFVRDKAGVLGELMSEWLRLHEFARNLAFAFYAASIYGFWVLVNSCDGEVGHDQLLGAEDLIIAYFAISILLFLRFQHLIAGATKRVFRSFIYICERAG